MNFVRQPTLWVVRQVFLAGLKSTRGPFTPKALEPHKDHPERAGRYLLIYYNDAGATSPGRHCHSTLSLTAIP